MQENNFDLIVIGSGPGGYVASIRAAQLGMKVGLIEKSNLGGICLNWGCIPTKALLKSAQVYNYCKHSNNYGITLDNLDIDFTKIISRSREIAGNMSKGIEFLLNKNKITVIKGHAKLESSNSVSVTTDIGSNIYFAKHIILATGARSKSLPSIKQDGKYIIGYREALNLPELPKSMVVIGSGAIGSELAFFYKSLGVDITLIEFLPEILPLEDEEVSKQIARSFKKMGMKILTNTSVDKVEVNEQKCIINYTDKKASNIIEADIVLSAVGVVPNIEDIGLETLCINIERGKIAVDKYFQTNVSGIYAIGDIIASPALAHVASAEAICCVEHIAGLNPEIIDYENIPSCVYTTPEIASVGITEKTAIARGIEYKVGKFPFIASGKAAAGGNKDGFVKLIFDNKDKLIGAHIIGDNIAEIISEMVVFKQLEGKAKELMKIIHPHPSLSESIIDATASIYNEAIHL